MVRPITNCRASIRSALTRRGTDHRLAKPTDHAADNACHIVKRQYATGRHERPGRRVNRQAVAVTQMLLPSAAAMRSSSARRRSSIRNSQQASRPGAATHTLRGARGRTCAEKSKTSAPGLSAARAAWTRARARPATPGGDSRKSQQRRSTWASGARCRRRIF